MRSPSFPASLRSLVSARVEAAIEKVVADHGAGKLPDFAYDRLGDTGDLQVVFTMVRPEENGAATAAPAPGRGT